MTRRPDIATAIADHLELDDAEMVSEFLMIVSTVGTDGSAGNYRVVTGPTSMALHQRLGLMDVMGAILDQATAVEFGDGDE